MVLLNIIGKSKPFSLPENWDEMTPRQTLSVFRAIERMNEHKNMKRFFGEMLDIFAFGREKKFNTLRWSNHAIETAELVLRFITEISEKSVRFDYDNVENQLPLLKIRRRFRKTISLKGTETLLANITLEEFDHAAKELRQYALGDNERLPYFVATLYRPIDKLTGERVQYDEQTLTERAKAINRGVKDTSKLKYIASWFGACLRYIQESDIEIDGETFNFSILFTSDNKNETSLDEKNKLGWLPIVFQFAQEGTFGSYADTYKAPLFDILRLMLHKYQESQRIKKEYEKINK